MKPLLNLLRTARHVAAVMPVTTPYPATFRPRHCAGGRGCLHEHADERRCACGQAIISQRDGSVTAQVQPLNSNAGRAVSMRHSAEGCHAVTPASAALRKAGA